jgi:hypothetical protein
MRNAKANIGALIVTLLELFPLSREANEISRTSMFVATK